MMQSLIIIMILKRMQLPFGLLDTGSLQNFWVILMEKGFWTMDVAAEFFCRFLQSKGAFVTGLDISKNMIKVAQRRNSGFIDYYTIADKGLDFLSDSLFDFAVSNFVLCTLPSQRKISLILDQIYRVLKKEGMFVLMNSNWDKSNGRDFVSFRLEYCKNLISGHPVTAIIKSTPPIMLHDYFWSIEEYRKILMEAGFRINGQREEIAESEDDLWLDEKKYPPYYAISAIK